MQTFHGVEKTPLFYYNNQHQEKRFGGSKKGIRFSKKFFETHRKPHGYWVPVISVTKDKTTDHFKMGSLLEKEFRIYFTPIGDDINLTLDIDGKIVMGVIDRDILNTIPNHPKNDTYIAFSSIDYNYYEWNSWSVKFHGHKIFSAEAKEDDGTYIYQNGVIPVSDENIRWLGRWTNDTKTAKAYFQSGLEIKINGSYLKVKTDKPIIVSVDGKDWQNYPAGTPTVFKSEKTGEHKIKIMSPYENTNPKISGFYSNAGVKVLAADKNKTVLFIGDSATAGYATKDKKFEKSIANNYALQAAERRDYAVSIVATANATLLAGEGADKLSMPQRYFKFGEQNSDAQNKAFEAYDEPDCIVVYLGSYGTNGGNAQGAYQSFIEQLRYKYPDSKIVCMTPISGKNTDAIKKSVGSIQKDGDKKVFFLDTKNWGVEKLSDGINPTQDGHKTMATKLAGVLKSVMSGKATVSITEDKSTNNTQNKKPQSDKTDVDLDVNVDVDVDVELEEVEKPQENGGIMDYLWLFIAAGGVVIVGLLAVIFWPNIKKLFTAKK